MPIVRSPLCRLVLPALRLLLALGGLGAGAVRLEAQAAPAPGVVYPTFSAADLREDLDRLSSLVASQHPQIYTDKVALEAAFADARAGLRDGMSELEFFRVLSGLVSRINCGHTFLQLSEGTEQTTIGQRRYVPLLIHAREDRLYVIERPDNSPVPRGSEVRAINGHRASQILQRFIASRPADGANETRKRRFINRQFGEFLHLYLDASTEFTVDFVRPGREEVETAVLAGIEPAAARALQPAGADDDVEMARLTFESDHARLWVRSFNFYDTAGIQRFRTLIDSMFAELAQRGAPALILDLRGNGGGEPRLGAHLLSYLIEQPVLYFAEDASFYPTLRTPTTPAANAWTGPLYVLVDGDVFSTTGHLVSLLKYHRIGRMIGEETGGSFSCTANNRNATLLHTRLRFSYATRTFTTAVTGLTPGRGVFPDDSIAPTLADELARRDAPQDFALQLIRGPGEPPVIRSHPVSQVVPREGPVSLHVQVESAPGTTFQWRRDGQLLPGATAPILTFERFVPTMAGAYDVVVANAAGSVTSTAARVEVGQGRGGIVNFSTRGSVTGGEEALVAGFVIADAQPRRLLIRGIGPGLGDLGVFDAIGAPALALYAGQVPIAANDGWDDGDTQDILAVSAQVGAFALAEGSRDGVILEQLTAGNYTARLTNPAGTGRTGLIEIYDATTAASPALVNLSTLAFLQSDSGPLVLGFVAAGNAPQTVLLRAVGPSLVDHGLARAHSQPRLTLYAGDHPLLLGASTEEAGSDRIEPVRETVGAFPLRSASADQVLLTTLQPGAYTIVVTGAGGEAGWVLAELYAVAPPQ